MPSPRAQRARGLAARRGGRRGAGRGACDGCSPVHSRRGNWTMLPGPSPIVEQAEPGQAKESRPVKSLRPPSGRQPQAFAFGARQERGDERVEQVDQVVGIGRPAPEYSTVTTGTPLPAAAWRRGPDRRGRARCAGPAWARGHRPMIFGIGAPRRAPRPTASNRRRIIRPCRRRNKDRLCRCRAAGAARRAGWCRSRNHDCRSRCPAR